MGEPVSIPRRQRVRTRLRAHLSRPRTLVLLTLILWIDAVSLSQTSRLAGVVSGVAFVPLGRAWASRYRSKAVLVREPGHHRPLCVIDDGSHRWPGAELVCYPYSHSRGIWGRTSREHSMSIGFYNYEWCTSDDPSRAVRVTPKDLQRLRDFYVVHAESIGYFNEHHAAAFRAAPLGARSAMKSVPLVSGYVHNAIALALLGAMARSCTLIPGERRRARARRRLDAGRCPSCMYDIRCLPEPRCPECGTQWELDTLRRAAIALPFPVLTSAAIRAPNEKAESRGYAPRGRRAQRDQTR